MTIAGQIDRKKLRYVLYARKSTEDENRQVRSIDDQIKDCLKIASDLGLYIVGEPIKERKSAKKPNQRPLFSKMIKDIEENKYDAILCWHPDRLCRNMLEGGQIINMLDEGLLKDICFHSHQFSNDANGKMLLGMLFVFSKQYSDDLSAKVSRGIRGNLDEGKSAGTPKFGYNRDESGLYRPNELFDLVKTAWVKRSDGDSVESIAKFLIDNGYKRVTKDSSRSIIPKISTVAKMFHDSFYYGLLVQADQTVDLRDIYDFEPVTDEVTFNNIQAISWARTKDKFTTKRATFYPLHGFVYCDVCKSSRYMLVGKNLSGSRNYVLSYRCDNPSCIRKPKSLRAKHVFNSIYDRLNNFKLSDKAYKLYSDRLDSLTDERVITIKQEIQSLRGAYAHVKKELETRALNLGVMDKESVIYKANEKRTKELAIEATELQEEINNQEEKIKNPSKFKLTKNEFLNLIKTASDKMKAGSAVEKDSLCRILFLNLHVDNEKVVNFIWSEPFASLVKAIELSSGRGDRT